ncbi:polysaccharide deacetylase family protein [Winogradskyella vincentii]|uniref:Polysaccharide deacetylase family protein n=1 Tax=Winogradskyella vincentii TaxID=2877122 RepID=A0ABS7Y089_9FLAO|nr:polysaccharide deacetylase family protein [Winogradskyella vincentii]MCA0152991.1 polysaccharide deacetylase family protein [Winogradskyella vincentii]
MKSTGKFIISLDFELLWGVRDIQTKSSYGRNILGVWEAVPKMLEIFNKYKVKATWATVGFLFTSSKTEIQSFSPECKPQYSNKNLSPYNGHLDLVAETEEEDKYHFASKLINLIKKYPDQEIATHTFSHYYCLEDGQTKENFKSDIIAAIDIAKKNEIRIKSLVFPRNQFNRDYLEIIKNAGITSYRGNEKTWFYDPTNGQKDNLKRRAIRLMDSYLNISGHNSYKLDEISKEEPFNVPSSRFLRPFSTKLKIAESIRLKRIIKSMTHAAKNGEVYHLWWHPHNFGVYQRENFEFLNRILEHYLMLNKKYGFESLTMNELSNILKQIHK